MKSQISFILYPSASGLGNFNNFIFLAYKAKNLPALLAQAEQAGTGIALAMASIFNAVGRKKKKIKSPNHFRLGICLCVFLFGCLEPSEIEKYGKHFQQHEDFESLNQVVNLLELGADTTFVKKILGEPINMGFDFRYLIDSIGPNNCVVGAVFHIDEQGKIDQKWLDEICE